MSDLRPPSFSENSGEVLEKFVMEFKERGQATIDLIRAYSMLERQSVSKNYLQGEWEYRKINMLGRAMFALPLGDTVIRTTEMESEDGGMLVRKFTIYALTPENWDLIRYHKAYSEMKPIKLQVDEL